MSLCVTRYSIEKSSDPEKYFYIEITSGSLMTVRSLDREEIGWHNITVLAMEMSMLHTHTHTHSHTHTHRLSAESSLKLISIIKS